MRNPRTDGATGFHARVNLRAAKLLFIAAQSVLHRNLLSRWVATKNVGALVFNYSIAFDRNNSLPLFYEAYPGSIVDVSQLQLMLEKANGYGYKRIGFILDRGYFSKENIRFMDRCGYEFIIMIVVARQDRLSAHAEISRAAQADHGMC